MHPTTGETSGGEGSPGTITPTLLGVCSVGAHNIERCIYIYRDIIYIYTDTLYREKYIHIHNSFDRGKYICTDTL